MNNTSATINIDGSIPVILTAINPATGQPIPGAVISDVAWNENNQIGEFSPTSDPNTFLFTPSKAGTVNFSASATITVN